jgi:hypothetical protein
MMRPIDFFTVAGIASVFTAVLLAQDPAWKKKPIAEWTAADAKQVLSDSPWTKSATPSAKQAPEQIAPALGGARTSRRGSRQAHTPSGQNGGRPVPNIWPAVTVRWESALAVQSAHLKAGDGNAPAIEGYYAIAVSGLPASLANHGGIDKLERDLKKSAEIQRPDKKAIRSTDAHVSTDDNNLTVLFVFPRAEQIVPSDQQVDFSARVEQFQIRQGFDLAPMTSGGKLDL